MALGCATAMAQPAIDSPPPLGLIVQLRDARSHSALAAEESRAGGADAGVAPDHSDGARQGALTTRSPSGAGREFAHAADRARWHRVLDSAGLSPALVELSTSRRNGRAARVIDFARPVSAVEAAAWLERLRALPEVEWAVANDREQPAQMTTPSDPMFDGPVGQWWLQAAGGSDANTIEWRRRGVPDLQRAWARSNGRAVAAVAVLDTGLTAHPELDGRMLPGIDLVSDAAMAGDGDGRDLDPADPGDWLDDGERAAHAAFERCALGSSSWHGTVTAALVAARTDDNAGVAAINWHGGVVPVRVAGKCGAAVADIVDGMRWAAGLDVPDGRGGWLPRNPNPVRVVNISFGGRAACHAAYQSTIDELRALGVVVVASAGNEHGAVQRPANCRGVVAVAALNRDGFKAHYSNFGPQVTIATVGGDSDGGAWGALLGDGGLLTLHNAGRTAPDAPGYARHAGTSFAAPLVAGTLSLMLSVNPALDVDHLVAGLTATARPHVRSPWLPACGNDNPGRCLCTASTCGPGMLDAEQALIYAAAPEAYAVPARQAEVLDNDDLRRASALGADLPAQAAAAYEPTGSGGGSLDGGALFGLAAVLAALTAFRRRA